MTAQPPRLPSPAPAAARPNPFAVTSGTALRFGLLVLAMSGAATTLGRSYVGWLPLGPGDIDPQGFRDCVFRILDDTVAGRPVPPGTWAERCGGWSASSSALLSLVPLVLFWTATFALYWVRPAARIRQRGLRPFPAGRLPGLAAELAALRTLAEVREDITYVVDLLDPGVTGLAFGRRGRRYVMLSRGLLHLYDTDPTAFRAVVLHELAHLRNRDVDIAFLTDSAWRIYLPALLLPGIVGAPLTPLIAPSASGPASFYLLGAWQSVLLGVVIPLARKSVLRSRELHADARVALIPGGAVGLASVLATAEEAERKAAAEAEAKRAAKAKAKARARSKTGVRAEATSEGEGEGEGEGEARARTKAGAKGEARGGAGTAADPHAEADAMDIWFTHPGPGTRLRALADPGRLFRFTPASALTLGVVGTYAYEPVTELIDGLTGLSRYEPPAMLPLGLVLGVGLALAIWRAELAAFLTGRRWEKADRVGKFFGAGLVLGALGSPQYAASIGSAVQPSPITLLSYALVLGAGGYLAVRWISGTARAWAPVVVAGRHSRAVVHTTVACAVLLLTVWLSDLLQLALWSETLQSNKRLGGGLPDGIRLVVGAVVQLMGVPPPLLIGLLLLTALVPLSGGVAARRTGVIAPDRFLLGPPPAHWQAPPPEPGPGVALRTALWASGTGAALWWSVHVFSALAAPSLLPWDPFLIGVVLAGLLQVVVALVAEYRTRAAARELGPLHGILAAAVSGAVLHPALIATSDHSRCLRFGFDAGNCHVVPTADGWSVALAAQGWGLIAASVVVLIRVGLIRRSRMRAQSPGMGSR
ncbi:M48 family metalloprotease [Streptomyces sp. NPDC093595]|uniref:M48 family metalloprotease n=1 Tax=Streptomyces sp. NPDC093595 TaxID=3366045 RepID=UPI00382DD41C